MAYDCITLKLRTPNGFNTYAFAEAVHRLIWDRLGMDRRQTGVLCYNVEPVVDADGSPFTTSNVEAFIRVEPGKLTEQKVWDSVQKYLTQNAKFPPELGYVRDVQIQNDVHRSEWTS